MLHKKLPLIAIFGGSFNPIHNGHLGVANIILAEMPNTEIYFVPCGQPVHREAFNTRSAERLEMIRLAIKHNRHYHVSTYEIDSPAPSYTIDTLRHFRKQFPLHPLAFIMGMDTFVSLDTAWGNDWHHLLDYVHLLIVPRRGDIKECSQPLKKICAMISPQKKELNNAKQGGILFLNTYPPEVSSSDIRRKLALHEDVSTLLPKMVYNHVQKTGIYHNTMTKQEKLLSLILETLENMKAEELVTYALSEQSDIASVAVICNGRSSRHVESIAENLAAAIKKSRLAKAKIEHDRIGEWVLIGLGSIVVHMMQANTRQYYDIDQFIKESHDSNTSPPLS
ncbi:MAG: nicotinate (nicotinamide) nucleotide adenylyltransferase [Gammaproteobacteria bacterium]|nr:nicotinate (nicotinamide) nucleotide adenylyltransferase [Gammaproteobacteria bacterium]